MDGSGGGRFIHVCLPNKGVIYPQLICDNLSLLKGKTSPAPQWRKHVRDIVDTGIEVIDIYPAFRKWSDEHGMDDLLFAKEHNISALGAKLIADTVARYLHDTTEGIRPQMKIQQQRIIFTHATKDGCYTFPNYINTVSEGNETKSYSTSNSDITIFGDCNLQSHLYCGAGIAANLAYNLQYPICDAGRILVFDSGRQADNKMSLQTLKDVRDNSKVIIYCAFASAAFTRTVEVTRREMILHPRLKPHKWAYIDLK